MADTALKLVLLGQDRTASKALKGVGREAGQTHGKLDRLKGGAKIAGAAVAAGLAVAATAAVDFAGDSLKAFADAEKSQKQLEDAYARFPRVASVNIETLRKLNQAIQRKTGADADDIAAGQAVLSRYKMTGKQLKEMTPLLVDYATRTGKDIPSAASTLGKALMGSARATKELGVNVKLGKDPAENYAKVMEALEGSVGGYAEKVPEAERKQKILQASFGDLQETVGEKLQPAMLGLVDAGQGVLDWLDQNPKVMEGATAAWDLFSMALGGIWDLVRKFVLPGLALINEHGVRPMLKGLQAITQAAADTFGWDWAKDAAKKLGEVDAMVGAIDQGLTDLGKDEPKLDVDDRQVKAKTKAIDTEIKRLNKQKVKLQSEGDTKGVKDIGDKIAKLKRQKHEVRVGVGLKRSGAQKASIVVSGSGGGGRAQIRMTASGHPSFPGGLSWVGESGPELLAIPAGSRIHSNGQSRAIENQARTSGRSPGPAVVANFTTRPAPPLEFAKYMEGELNKLWRSRGGRFIWDKPNKR